MAHAFISYVREDSAIVDRISSELRRHGVKVWLDRDALSPGSFWKDAITDAIRTGVYFIACFSSASLSKNTTYMNEELSLALEQLRLREHDARWFIPLLLDDVLPPAWPFRPNQTLRDFQGLRMFPNIEDGLPKLLLALGYDDPVIAEEALLLDLFESRFERQRSHAITQLLRLHRLTPAGEAALLKDFDSRPPGEQEKALLNILKCTANNIDRRLIAELGLRHNNPDVRRMSFYYISGNFSDYEKYIAEAIADAVSRNRLSVAEQLVSKSEESNGSAKAFCSLIFDEDNDISNFVVRKLLTFKKNIWDMLGDRGVEKFHKKISQMPEKWLEYLRYIDSFPPVGTAADRFLALLIDSSDRHVQNLAISRVTGARPELVKKLVLALRGEDVGRAVSAAYTLGYTENVSRSSMTALAHAARFASNVDIRTTAAMSLRRLTGEATRSLFGGADGPAEIGGVFPAWFRDMEIVNERGFEARQSALFVKTASKFDADVYVSRSGDNISGAVNATSIMGLMMLAAGIGSVIRVTAAGVEALEALDALEELVASRFGEER